MRSLVSTKGKIEVIPCGTDISSSGSVSPWAGRAKLGLDSEDKVVLHVGRFDRRKGIETLVKAVGKVKQQPNLKLIIARGSMPGRKDGKERVETMFSWDGVASQLDEQYLSELSKLH